MKLTTLLNNTIFWLLNHVHWGNRAGDQCTFMEKTWQSWEGKHN